jgi:hypothetical protein
LTTHGDPEPARGYGTAFATGAAKLCFARHAMTKTRIILAGCLLLLNEGPLHADPVPLVVQYSDPLIVIGGLGGGRFQAVLGNDPVHVYCIDFSHYFKFNSPYWVDVTPLYGDVAGQTRWGSVGISGWTFANNQFTALQRYMMAAWLTTQYLPFFANWSDPNSQYQAKGIQSAIWALLDPSGVPNPPASGNRDYWLQQAMHTITLPDYDEATDPFYRYFRVVSPQIPTANTPQEFIIQVTPEPASFVLITGALGWLGLTRLRQRRGAKR